MVTEAIEVEVVTEAISQVVTEASRRDSYRDDRRRDDRYRRGGGGGREPIAEADVVTILTETLETNSIEVVLVI